MLTPEKLRAENKDLNSKYKAQYKEFRRLFEEWLTTAELDISVRGILEALLYSAERDELYWFYQVWKPSLSKRYTSPSAIVVQELQAQPGSKTYDLGVRWPPHHPMLASRPPAGADDLKWRLERLGSEQAWVWLLLYPHMISAWDCLRRLKQLDAKLISRQKTLLGRF